MRNLLSSPRGTYHGEYGPFTADCVRIINWDVSNTMHSSHRLRLAIYNLIHESSVEIRDTYYQTPRTMDNYTHAKRMYIIADYYYYYSSLPATKWFINENNSFHICIMCLLARLFGAPLPPWLHYVISMMLFLIVSFARNRLALDGYFWPVVVKCMRSRWRSSLKILIGKRLISTAQYSVRYVIQWMYDTINTHFWFIFLSIQNYQFSGVSQANHATYQTIYCYSYYMSKSWYNYVIGIYQLHNILRTIRVANWSNTVLKKSASVNSCVLPPRLATESAAWSLSGASA